MLVAAARPWPACALPTRSSAHASEPAGDSEGGAVGIAERQVVLRDPPVDAAPVHQRWSLTALTTDATSVVSASIGGVTLSAPPSHRRTEVAPSGTSFGRAGSGSSKVASGQVTTGPGSPVGDSLADSLVSPLLLLPAALGSGSGSPPEPSHPARKRGDPTATPAAQSSSRAHHPAAPIAESAQLTRADSARLGSESRLGTDQPASPSITSAPAAPRGVRRGAAAWSGVRRNRSPPPRRRGPAGRAAAASCWGDRRA